MSPVWSIWYGRCPNLSPEIMPEKIAVLSYNLGAPESLDTVEPFLFNLFNDPAIIPLPTIFRTPLAKLISWRRTKFASEVYRELGGSSPLLPNTEKQVQALEQRLRETLPDSNIKCFIAMRYWRPFLEQTYQEMRDWGADRVILLSLYPQFSTSTVGSFMRIWYQQQAKNPQPFPFHSIACYPVQKGFIEALSESTYETYKKAGESDKPIRILFSAHGIPKDMVKAGDGYPFHCGRTIEETVKQLASRHDLENLDWVASYQSRVGPKEWLQPYTEDEIKRAARDGVALVIVPIAFVSEHSETLVELDIEYRELAEEHGLHAYYRAPTVSEAPAFINGLADMVTQAITDPPLEADGVYNGDAQSFCPPQYKRCVCMNNPEWQGSRQ